MLELPSENVFKGTDIVALLFEKKEIGTTLSQSLSHDGERLGKHDIQNTDNVFCLS